MAFNKSSALLGIILATGVSASEPTEQLRSYMDADIRSWASSPTIISAIKAQNSRTADIDQAEIDAKEALWAVDVITRTESLVDGVLENATADFLRRQAAQSDGVITEVFIMDAKGLNVAASLPTSDYWQGDEAKFTETFSRGPNAYHLGSLEFDDSTQSVQAQISLSIADPVSGEVIGAMTVGVNVGELP
jgi:hypothetical protein